MTWEFPCSAIRQWVRVTRASTIRWPRGERAASWTSAADRPGCKLFRKSRASTIQGDSYPICNWLRGTTTKSGDSLQWTIQGDGSTVDHYTAYISTDGQNLMFLRALNAGTRSVNLCKYSVPNG